MLYGLMRLDRQGRGGIVEWWADLGWWPVIVLTTSEKDHHQHEQMGEIKVDDLL